MKNGGGGLGSRSNASKVCGCLRRSEPGKRVPGFRRRAAEIREAELSDPMLATGLPRTYRRAAVGAFWGAFSGPAAARITNRCLSQIGPLPVTDATGTESVPLPAGAPSTRNDTRPWLPLDCCSAILSAWSV